MMGESVVFTHILFWMTTHVREQRMKKNEFDV
jgi:hypothetical protein